MNEQLTEYIRHRREFYEYLDDIRNKIDHLLAQLELSGASHEDLWLFESYHRQKLKLCTLHLTAEADILTYLRGLEKS